MSNQIDYEFSAFPLAIVESGLLSALDANEFKILYFLTVRSQNYRRYAIATIEGISNATGLSKPTVIKGLSLLEKQHLIKRVNRGNGKSMENKASRYKVRDLSRQQTLDRKRFMKYRQLILENHAEMMPSAVYAYGNGVASVEHVYHAGLKQVFGVDAPSLEYAETLADSLIFYRGIQWSGYVFTKMLESANGIRSVRLRHNQSVEQAIADFIKHLKKSDTLPDEYHNVAVPS